MAIDQDEVRRVLTDAFWRYVELAIQLRALPEDARELNRRRAALRTQLAELTGLLGGDPLHVLSVQEPAWEPAVAPTESDGPPDPPAGDMKDADGARGNGKAPLDEELLQRVRAALPGSVSDVAGATGLARWAIRRALAELAEHGAVVEDGQVRSTGGRPATRYARV